MTKKNKKILTYLEITFGVILVDIAYYFFLLPSSLVVGGVMGLSIIFKDILNPTLFMYTANVIFLIIGGLILGKQFFIRTVYGTLLTPSIVAVLELCNVPTDLIMRDISSGNYLLIVAIGATLLTGIGLGIVVRNGATTGGMDVPQRVISKVFRLPFSSVMYVIDGSIILIGVLVFGIEKGFFAAAVLITSGYLIDIMCVGGVSRRAAYIVTTKPDEIRDSIFKEIDRGVTKIDVVGGYTNTEKTMLVCIMAKNEYYKLRTLIDKIDENAFVFITKTNEVLGEGFGTYDKE